MQFVLDNLTNFGLAFVLIWQIVTQIKSGNSALTTKMLNDYKARNEQLEDINAKERSETEKFKNEMKGIIDGYKAEIVRLTASNEEKEAHNKSLKEILQDKNPEVVSVLKEIKDFLKKSDEKNTKILSYQTEMLEEWRSRSRKIDEASLNHEGELTRIPN